MPKEPEDLLKELSLEEKIALVSGTDFMYSNPVPRLSIPSIRMSDGPHGLRVQNGGGDNGINPSEPATCFPPACLSSCSWNEELLKEEGEAMGEEANHYGIGVILGPGSNIKRNPLGGRNFEYFSEDPLLAGLMASSIIEGIQSQGVSVSMKHFATNNQENYRFMGDSLIDQKALREIYLKPFEIAVKKAKPDTLMCAYNKINGVYCCQNKTLLTDILRQEWGFKGLVMTDWGATHDRVEMLKAGLDLEMPGDTEICRKWIYDAVKDGSLSEEILDKAVLNVLKLVKKHENQVKSDANFEEHASLALRIALDSAVLLKNDGVLPLKKDSHYLVVGDLFEKMRYQGSGSSMINPYKLITPKEAFDEAGISYTYCRGYQENKLEPNEDLLKEIDDKIDGFDTVLAFIGLTDYVESEGADRESFVLPKNQIEAVNHLISKGKKVVLVLYGGSPYEIPGREEANAILNMYLPGECGGLATQRLLFGEANPSGKLSESWPKEYASVLNGESYSKSEIEEYREGIYVGYRYYQNNEDAIAYPFGFGLSYTKFKYDDIEIKENENDIEVSASITNIGSFNGAEIVQLYVRKPNDSIKELKGFTKAYLNVNETKKISIKVSKDELRYFDIKENRFLLLDGEYVFDISSNSIQAELTKTLYIKGESQEDPYPKNLLEMTSAEFRKFISYEPPKKRIKPITLESRFSDLKATFMGKVLYNAVLGVARKDMKKAKKLPEGPERDNRIKGAMFLERILDSNSIITMSMSAGKSFPYPLALLMMHMANGHIIKGLRCLTKKLNAPILPRDAKETSK